MRIEVVYATPDQQLVHRTDVNAGTTAAEVLDEACATTAFAGLHWRECAIGVFGEVCEPGMVLKAGDRVEIYRPLLVDPKESRRRRAEKHASQKN